MKSNVCPTLISEQFVLDDTKGKFTTFYLKLITNWFASFQLEFLTWEEDQLETLIVVNISGQKILAIN